MKHLFTVLLLLLFCSAEVHAQGTAAGLRAGTHGPGLEVARAILPNLNVRLGAGYLPYGTDGVYTEGDASVQYQLDSAVQTASLLADWYPFPGAFRLSGGLMYNGFSADLAVEAPDGFTAGNRNFNKEQVGTLTGRLDYGSKIGPYLGLGFGNPVAAGKGLGFMFDLGAMYTGALQFNMEGTGMIEPTAEQDAVITEKLQGLRLWPVLSLGMTYQF